MAKYAEIDSNKVVDIFIPQAGFELKDCFHEGILHRFVEIQDDDFVLPGYAYDPLTGEFTAPAEPEAPAEPA